MFPRLWVDPAARSGVPINGIIPRYRVTDIEQKKVQLQISVLTCRDMHPGERFLSPRSSVVTLSFVMNALINTFALTHMVVVWEYFRQLQSGCRYSVQGLKQTQFSGTSHDLSANSEFTQDAGRLFSGAYSDSLFPIAVLSSLPKILP
jgi:hypothetical protein